jgi:7-carboxy-7-deazaguanine synthase
MGMTEESGYPVAEYFVSIQGEGIWTGTRMAFIRLAGCNVGRYHSSRNPSVEALRVLSPEKHSVCCAYGGQDFLCDTDYRVVERPNFLELYKRVRDSGVKHICLTGGEPFMHQFTRGLIERFSSFGYKVHIETSGTKPIFQFSKFAPPDKWVTCSPKQGFLLDNILEINEFKFVVAAGDNLVAIEGLVKAGNIEGLGIPIFVQPVNGVDTVNKDNVRYVTEVVLAKHPHWRLSTQLHKLLGMQ